MWKRDVSIVPHYSLKAIMSFKTLLKLTMYPHKVHLHYWLFLYKEEGRKFWLSMIIGSCCAAVPNRQGKLNFCTAIAGYFTVVLKSSSHVESKMLEGHFSALQVVIYGCCRKAQYRSCLSHEGNLEKCIATFYSAHQTVNPGTDAT